MKSQTQQLPWFYSHIYFWVIHSSCHQSTTSKTQMRHSQSQNKLNIKDRWWNRRKLRLTSQRQNIYAKLVCMLMLLLRQYQPPYILCIRKIIQPGTGKGCYFQVRFNLTNIFSWKFFKHKLVTWILFFRIH